jgi:hypothetical protein
MIRSGIRGLAPALACAALALSAAACQSNGDGGGGGGGARSGSDAEGAVLGGGAVRIGKIDRSAAATSGVARYWVDNISGTDQEDLVWSVTFTFPPAKGGGDIELAEEAETTSEKTLVLLRGETAKLLEAQCAAFESRRQAGQAVTGTRLNVMSNPPVLTLARAPGHPGTRFLGKIECVGQSDVWASNDEMTIEFENVSTSKAADLEVQVVFTDTRARTAWKAIPPIAPGARAKVVVDLRGVDMGARDFLVKVRQQAL